MAVFFKEDTAAWNKEFNSSAGMVGKKLRRMAKETELFAKARAPFRTGQLMRSIKADSVPRVTAGGMRTEVTAGARHAWMVHEGTRPHVIEPDTTEVLRFPTRGGIVFTDRVEHPGTEAKPFLMKALDDVMRIHAKNVRRTGGR